MNFAVFKAEAAKAFYVFVDITLNVHVFVDKVPALKVPVSEYFIYDILYFLVVFATFVNVYDKAYYVLLDTVVVSVATPNA